MVFLRNECSFHVRGAAVLETDSLGLDAISLWCSTERTLSGRFVSPAALQFLLFHRIVSKRHSPFVFALFVPRIYSSSSAIPERIGESPVCDVS